MNERKSIPSSDTSQEPIDVVLGRIVQHQMGQTGKIGEGTGQDGVQGEGRSPPSACACPYAERWRLHVLATPGILCGGKVLSQGALSVRAAQAQALL